MAVKRYELSEAQWQRIPSLLPGKVADPGRSGTDNRLFVNRCLWVVRIGATCWNAMGSGRASIGASVGGTIPVSGSGCSTR